MTAKKGAPELVAEIAQHPTIDRFLDRDPNAQPFSREELLELVNQERADRARFILAAEAKRAKKQGVVE